MPNLRGGGTQDTHTLDGTIGHHSQEGIFDIIHNLKLRHHCIQYTVYNRVLAWFTSC